MQAFSTNSRYYIVPKHIHVEAETLTVYLPLTCTRNILILKDEMINLKLTIF